MSIDYSSIAMNSAILASILVPVLQYINKKSQSYFLDLMFIPFVIFLVTTATSVINPNGYTFVLFVLGLIATIVIYGMIVFERYFFEKYKLTRPA